jgi:hypothetical protein
MLLVLPCITARQPCVVLLCDCNSSFLLCDCLSYAPCIPTEHQGGQGKYHRRIAQLNNNKSICADVTAAAFPAAGAPCSCETVPGTGEVARSLAPVLLVWHLLHHCVHSILVKLNNSNACRQQSITQWCRFSVPGVGGSCSHT